MVRRRHPAVQNKNMDNYKNFLNPERHGAHGTSDELTPNYRTARGRLVRLVSEGLGAAVLTFAVAAFASTHSPVNLSVAGTAVTAGPTYTPILQVSALYWILAALFAFVWTGLSPYCDATFSPNNRVALCVKRALRGTMADFVENAESNKLKNWAVSALFGLLDILFQIAFSFLGYLAYWSTTGTQPTAQYNATANDKAAGWWEMVVFTTGATLIFLWVDEFKTIASRKVGRAKPRYYYRLAVASLSPMMFLGQAATFYLLLSKGLQFSFANWFAVSAAEDNWVDPVKNILGVLVGAVAGGVVYWIISKASDYPAEAGMPWTRDSGMSASLLGAAAPPAAAEDARAVETHSTMRQRAPAPQAAQAGLATQAGLDEMWG